MPLFKKKQPANESPADPSMRSGACPKCGNNPGIAWAICPQCGFLPSSAEADTPGATVIAHTKASDAGERTRFDGERNFYKAVTPPPMETPETLLEGSTTVERPEPVEHVDRTVILSGTNSPLTADADTAAALEQAAPGPLAFLVERNGMNAGAAHFLYAETLIGRADEAEITIANSAVSKRHARIRYEAGRFVFRDLASSNFSFIVGADGARTRLTDPYVLRDGDTVDLGDARLTFLLIEDEESAEGEPVV